MDLKQDSVEFKWVWWKFVQRFFEGGRNDFELIFY